MGVVSGEVMLGWRRAMRGSVLAALLAALALCLLALPGTDDAGLVRTGYSVLLAWALLLISALWCGGAAYALDRERHRLTLTFTKPLRRWTLWWGRFLGTLAPFAFALVVLWGLLAFRPLPEGRAVVPPDLPDLELASKLELARLRLLGRVPEGVPEGRLLRAVRDDLAGRYTELRQGTEQRYDFRGVERFRGWRANPAKAAFRLSGAPFLGAKDVLNLEVEIACDGRTATLRPGELRDSGFELPLPDGLLSAETSALPVTVTLRRLDANEAASVLYRAHADLALLLPGQSPLTNLTAFCLVLLFTVAMAVALGTALGCAFSLPVTLFAGTLAVLAATSASLSPETTVADETMNLWARISATVSWGLAKPFRGLIALNPLGCLLNGEAITLSALFRLLTFSVTPWVLLCSLAAPLSPVRDEDL